MKKTKVSVGELFVSGVAPCPLKLSFGIDGAFRDTNLSWQDNKNYAQTLSLCFIQAQLFLKKQKKNQAI